MLPVVECKDKKYHRALEEKREPTELREELLKDHD